MVSIQQIPVFYPLILTNETLQEKFPEEITKWFLSFLKVFNFCTAFDISWWTVSILFWKHTKHRTLLKWRLLQLTFFWQKKQTQCFNIEGNARIDCLLPQQKFLICWNLVSKYHTWPLFVYRIWHTHKSIPSCPRKNLLQTKKEDVVSDV